MGGSKNL